MNVPLARMYVDDEIIEAVKRVLRSGRYVYGEENQGFEEEFADYIGVDHALAVNSGTSALHLAYRSLGLRPGDEVIMPSHTFFATAEPVLEVGARPVFVDIDPVTYTIDPKRIEEVITPRTVGIVAVHIYGHPSDMDPIIKVAEEHDLWVLEDACQAHGALYRGRKVGSIGDVAAFSFYPSKNMTVAGEGGMITTDDDGIAERAWMLRDHGRCPGDRYIHRMVGYNYRMSEIHAAIGRIQLKHLEEWIARRREIASIYSRRIEGAVTPSEAEGCRHIYHLYVLRTPEREALSRFLAKRGVSTLYHYPVPVHRQPVFEEDISLPITERVASEVISIPMHPLMTDEEIDHVIESVNAFFTS